MEIKTKYNIGDELYYMEDNEVLCCKIVSIICYSQNNILYDVNIEEEEGYGYCFVDESEIDTDTYFTSKEKLLASL